MSGRRPRVLFVISSLSFGGGAERTFSRVINALSDDIQPSVLVFEKRNVMPVRSEVHLASSDQIRSLGSGFKAILQRAIALRWLAREFQPDVVIGTQTIVNLTLLVFASLGSLRQARRCIVRVAYDPFEAFKARTEFSYKLLALLEGITVVILSRVGYAVFPSFVLKRKFEDKTPVASHRTFVIPNSCDTTDVRRLSTEPVDGWPSEPVIISVGRLDPEKNPLLLVKAFSQVRRVKVCKLAFVGTGRLEPEAKVLADKLGVASDVIFLGEQENPFKFVARSRVFVLSSGIEGMPNALIEAMTLGIPVITTDTDGSKEVIGEKPAGIIVPRDNPSSLAKAILDIQEDEEMHNHYAEMATKRSEYFDSMKSSSKYLELFKLVGQGGSK